VKVCRGGLFIGHVVKKGRSGTVIDYGVVPMFGCAVKTSVMDVVTNAWPVCLSLRVFSLMPSLSHACS